MRSESEASALVTTLSGTLRLMLHYVDAAEVHRLYDEHATLGGQFKVCARDVLETVFFEESHAAAGHELATTCRQRGGDDARYDALP